MVFCSSFFVENFWVDLRGRDWFGGISWEIVGLELIGLELVGGLVGRIHWLELIGLEEIIHFRKNW